MLLRDSWHLTRRNLVASFRNPFVYIPNFIISLFFLFVYTAGVGAVANLPELNGVSYLAFILPVAVVSAALGAASGAVDTLVKDLESGYFSRLMLTPASRFSIVLGPIITGMFHLLIQTLLLITIALLMGLKIYSGFMGLLLILLLVVGIGLGFTGYATAIALATKSSQAVSMGTMIFFPLLFLSTTFVPMNLIEKGWFRIAATINPTTYIFDGMRALLIEGWMPSYILYGLVIGFGSALITITFATIYARKAFNG